MQHAAGRTKAVEPAHGGPGAGGAEVDVGPVRDVGRAHRAMMGLRAMRLSTEVNGAAHCRIPRSTETAAAKLGLERRGTFPENGGASCGGLDRHFEAEALQVPDGAARGRLALPLVEKVAPSSR